MEIPKNKNVIETNAFFTWLADDDILVTVVKPGAEISLKDAQENSAAVCKLANKNVYPLLVDQNQIKSIPKEARSYFGAADRNRNANFIAILIDSPVSRMIGNFFIGLDKPTAPTKLFTSENEAIEWLKSNQSGSNCQTSEIK